MVSCASLTTSPTVVDAMIRVWKIARLNSGAQALAYPSTSLIARCVELGGTDGVMCHSYRGNIPASQGLTDAERVQSIVDKMPDELRNCFEAYHLALIGEKSYQRVPHRIRAGALKITRNVYNLRVKSGWNFVQDWLPEMLASKNTEAYIMES